MNRRRRSVRATVQEELEILPMMNLFVVLIPMLLLSAVFLEMSVIRVGLPSDDASEKPAEERLGLAVLIGDEAWVVKGRKLEPQVVLREGEDAEARLRAALVGVSERFPDDHDVTVRSGPRTRYEDIVQVMDAGRESGFANVSLAGGDS
jgi:biopolymer transport protein ExbD